MIGKAAIALDCDLLRKEIERAGFLQHCEVICRVVLRLALRLGVQGPVLGAPGDTQQEPMRSKRLGISRSRPDSWRASRARSPISPPPSSATTLKLYRAIVDRFGLGPYCWQVCGWVCSEVCYEYCVCVCPPKSTAYFIKVGKYEYSEADPAASPKIESQIGGSGLTSDSRAFFSTLRLNGGFKIQDLAPHIQYRFETIPTDAAGHPLMNATWQPVLAAPGAGVPAQIVYKQVGMIWKTVFGLLDAQLWITVPPDLDLYTEDLLGLDTTNTKGHSG